MAAGWNKGRKWSAEVKQRISEAMLKSHPMRGKHWSLEMRKRMGEGQRRAIELRRKQMLLLLLLLHQQQQHNKNSLATNSISCVLSINDLVTVDKTKR